MITAYRPRGELCPRESCEVTVYSIDGRVALMNQLTTGQNSLDTSVLEDGNYFFLVASEKNAFV